MARKLVLLVVDGMTPAAFERAVEGGRAPALSLLADRGDYRQVTSVFPALTPGRPRGIPGGCFGFFRPPPPLASAGSRPRRAGRASHPLARLVEPRGAPHR